MATTTKFKFCSGQVCLTRAVALTMEVNDQAADSDLFSQFLAHSLSRHLTGDWGDVCHEDKQANETALAHGNLRLFSVYKHPIHPTIWIVTEADRSATTVLFPEDY